MMIRRSNQAISALAHSSDRRVAEMSDSKLPADELADWQAEDGDWLETVTGDVTAPAPVAEQSDGFCMVCPPSRTPRRECWRSSGVGSLADAAGAPTPVVAIASTASAQPPEPTTAGDKNNSTQRAPLQIAIDKSSYKPKRKPCYISCCSPKCETRATAPSDFNGKGKSPLC
jgi:hypothetical protein